MRRKRIPRGKSVTRICRPLWKACYPGVPWPKGWTVQWVGFMRGAAGLCDYGTKRILLSSADHGAVPARIAVNALVPASELRLPAEFGYEYAQVFAGWAYSTDGQYRGKMNVLRTLVHEFTHVRWGRKLRHGREFRRLIEAAYARLWT